MVWSEVEPLADVIFVSYNSQQNTNIQKNEAVAEIILGQLEPSGLLVFQQPKNMEEVEKQLEDVPRDMECYKDSAGNTYDFAFGLNWSGVINDSRVKTYSAAPLTQPENFDYPAYKAAHAAKR
jgi:beta-glucosidase